MRRHVHVARSKRARAHLVGEGNLLLNIKRREERNSVHKCLFFFRTDGNDRGYKFG